MLNPELALPLPDLHSLGVDEAQLPLDPCRVKSVVWSWFSRLSKLATSGDAQGLSLLFHRDAYWKDILVMTWDFRTFAGAERIQTMLNDRLADAQLANFSLSHEEYTGLQRPFPDLAWIQFCFRFETRGFAIGTGVVRLVPEPRPSAAGIVVSEESRKDELVWKAHTVLTNLDGLKDYPEKLGALREQDSQAGNRWHDARQQELAAQEDPTVLVAGGAQAGMEIAARLKYLGVKVLVVEKEDRIGGNWRKRYDALCLHDPVWYDHMPYLPFPPTWPAYTPALKMADWLEFYADCLELPIWLSSTVSHVEFDETNGLWNVDVQRKGHPDRLFKVKHFILATGILGGQPKMPSFPGRESFSGKVLHSLDHKTASDFAGKKVVVVGSCTSAHDICADFVNAGIDVTMVQRGSTHVQSVAKGNKIILSGLYEENGPPVEIADLLGASFPNLMVARLAPRRTDIVQELDKDLLDGLRKRGFKLNRGYMDCGPTLTGWDRAGGYYLDVGASQMIIDGRIKLKNDSTITSYVPSGLRFENESILEADVIIFATGFGAYRDALLGLFTPEQHAKIKPAWGLDWEGELQGCYRDMGLPRLWCMMGNLAFCRFHSKHLALQIKAMEEGLFDGTRYEGVPPPAPMVDGTAKSNGTAKINGTAELNGH